MICASIYRDQKDSDGFHYDNGFYYMHEKTPNIIIQFIQQNIKETSISASSVPRRNI